MSESFNRLQEVFREAEDLDGEGRAALVARLRASEPEVAEKLARMLDMGESSASFLNKPPEGLEGGRAVFEPRPGESVGGFRVIELIASGGMGSVYRAEQTRPKRVVALKVLRGGLASRDMRLRFELEAEILGTLDHPGIARIYEAGLHTSEAGEIPYFAMELVEGAGLGAWAGRERRSPEALVGLMVRICNAIEHAHQKGVIHRDLKPENILIDGRDRPRIVDFGIARAAEVGPESMITRSGEIFGTLRYMSPEQTLGDPSHVDTRADVYALGVILYELLSGRTPHGLEGLSIPDAVRAIQERTPALLGRLVPQCRGDVEAVVARALEGEKERRYPTASSLGADLRRILLHEPVEARTPSTFYRLKKLVRRNRVVATSLAAVFALLVTLTVFAWMAERRAVEQGQRIAAKNVEITKVSEARLRALSFVQRTVESVGKAQNRSDETLRGFLERFENGIRNVFAKEPVLCGGFLRAASEARIGLTDIAKAEALDREIEERYPPRNVRERYQDMRRRVLTLSARRETRAARRLAEEALALIAHADFDLHITALIGLGRVLARERRFGAAIESFREAVELLGDRDPTEEPHLYHLYARALRKNGDLDAADALLEGQLPLYEGRPERQLRSWRVLFLQEQAEVAIGRRDGERAASLAHRADETARGFMSEWELLTFFDPHVVPRTLIGRHRFDEAETLLCDLRERQERAGVPPGGLDETARLLGVVYALTDRPRKSIEVLKHQIAWHESRSGDSSPGFVHALMTAGRTYRELGEFDAAMDSFRRAAKLSAIDGDTLMVERCYRDLGLLLWERGRKDEAIDVLRDQIRALVELHGNDSTAVKFERLVLGTWLMRLDRKAEALHELGLLDDMTPAQVAERPAAAMVAYVTYGELLYDADRIPEATRALQSCVELAPKGGREGASAHRHALRRLVYVYEDTGAEAELEATHKALEKLR